MPQYDYEKRIRHSPTADEVYAALVEEEQAAFAREGRKAGTTAPDTGAIESRLVAMLNLKRFPARHIEDRTSPVTAGSVRRQLENLVDEGRVLEVRNRGGYWVSPRAKCWSTPEGEKRRVELEEQIEAGEAERLARVESVRARCEAVGLHVGRDLSMDLDDLEKLVKMAGL